MAEWLTPGWALVPNLATPAMLDACGKHADIGQLMPAWRAMLKAAPSSPAIPRPVWDARVERAAQAMYEAYCATRNSGPSMATWDRIGPAGKAWRAEADAALRAADLNPRVEGDEGA